MAIPRACRAGLDRDLLDEARHQHPAQQQAARELLGQGGLSRAGGDVPGGSCRSRRRTTQATWPITEMVVNSVIADPIGGTRLPAAGFAIEGVAWDRGHGIKQVEVSLDGGKSWKQATLGKDLGRFAFRAFSFDTGKIAGRQLRAVVACHQQRRRDAGGHAEVQSRRLPQQRAAADSGHRGIGRRACSVYLTVALLLRRPGRLADEPVTLKPGPGLDAVQASCATCHTLNYIRMNSVFLTPDVWKAEVTKMRTALVRRSTTTPRPPSSSTCRRPMRRRRSRDVWRTSPITSQHPESIGKSGSFVEDFRLITTPLASWA